MIENKNLPNNSDFNAIKVTGAKEHNLKNIDIGIPRRALTVVTGVSGSGKSSLVFDTILAEAQRRFFYTLSHYSRQFLQLGPRPNVGHIDGLSPAIGLAQNETLPSKRASVGTLTDLAELTAVMAARFGTRLCPKHALPTSAMSLEAMVDQICKEQQGKLLAVCAPVVENKKGQFRANFTAMNEKGYLRAYIDGKVLPLSPLPKLAQQEKHTVKLIVDFVRIETRNKTRLLRSMQVACEESKGYVECHLAKDNGQLEKAICKRFSLTSGCSLCQFSWPKLDPRHFSANSLGRCKVCHGIGSWSSVDDSENSSKNGQMDRFDHPSEADLEEAISDTFCESCQGSGIDEEYQHIHLASHSVQNLQGMSLAKALEFWQKFDDQNLLNNPAFNRVRDEIISKLSRLCAVGLTYLQMQRRIHTLSGGELQRLKLANVLSENFRGVLYILDEPSQGLHPSEIDQLIQNLRKLCDQGNTIIMVDHDEQLIRNSDWIIDMGPGGGAQGGYHVATFKPEDAHKFTATSKTAYFLSSKPHLKPASKKLEKEFITLEKATLFNLKLAQVKFLRAALNVVTGVSGAGKSSLVVGTLYPLCKALSTYKKVTAPTLRKLQKKHHVANICGYEGFEVVDIISRKPLARSSASMPATYLDVFTYIRQIFEKLPAAQILGLVSRDFSLHVKGGRCEACSGKGQILLSMKFLADARVPCSYCHGKRYQAQVLSVHYRNHSLADILDLTLEEACVLFKNHPRIVKKLAPALDLGLGYLKLGQPSLSLSGGESQRLKLVPYLSKVKDKNRLLILDEPTQGLHTQDVHFLVKSLQNLVTSGATLVVIEHSHDLIDASDWLIDLGPSAGDLGGKLVFEGPPAKLPLATASLTSRYWGRALAETLAKNK